MAGSDGQQGAGAVRGWIRGTRRPMKVTGEDAPRARFDDHHAPSSFMMTYRHYS